MKSMIGHRLYPNAARDEAAAAEKRARPYVAPQAPNAKPSVGMGARRDGGPAFAQVPQRGESAAKAECLGLVEQLRGGK